MTPLLARSSLRFYLRHPWLGWLSIIGVALGVAVVVAVDLAAGSARTSFARSVELLGGGASHRVVAAHHGIDERDYVALQMRFAARVTPVVEGVLELPGRTLVLRGGDLVAELHGAAPGQGGGAVLEALLVAPGSVLLHPTVAAELGVVIGGRFAARISGRDHELHLAGLLDDGEAPRARLLEGIAVADIATVQELTGQVGRLTRIDVTAPSEGRVAWLATLRAALPVGVLLESVAEHGRFMIELTEAFSLNLSALSLMALLVGAFLVYNMTGFAVLQRLPELAVLRSLGVSRGELFRLVSGEALTIGLCGSLLGVLVGTVLGRGLVGLVSGTIDALYVAMDASLFHLDPGALAGGLLLGIGTTWLAALRPAVEAMRSGSMALLRRSRGEERARRGAWVAAAVGLPSMLLAIPIAHLSAGLAAGFVALFLLILGAALVTPLALLGLGRLPRGRRWPGGPVLRLAVGGLAATLSRTGVAAAALTVAVATTVGVGEMIGSFRTTVEDWLGQRLQADVYVSSAGAGERLGMTPLPSGLAEELAALPGVRATSRFLGVAGRTPAGPVNLAVVDNREAGRAGYRFKLGDPASAWTLFDAGALLLSEAYAYRHDLRPGDAVTLLTPAGMRPFPVAGVYFDYGSASGNVLIARTTYEAHWGPMRTASLGLYARSEQEAEVLLSSARRATEGAAVRLRSNRALREASLALFDRTFRITSVLRLLVVLVAFAGVLSACLALQLERRRELAMLRALGLLPAEMRLLVTLQAGLLGLVAGLLALPLGLMQASLLTGVINQRAFGWSLPLQPGVAPLAEALLLAVGAALIAGLLASRSATLAPARLLGDD